MNDVDTALERWRAAGLIDEATAAALREFEASQESDGGSGGGVRSRLADFATYLAAATILAAVWTLATPSDDDGWGRAAPHLVGFGLAAAVSLSGARWGLARATDAFAGAALVFLVTGFGTALALIGDSGEIALGWLLVTAAAVVTGAALARRTRSPLAAAGAAVGLVALPAALALELSGVDRGLDDAVVQELTPGELWLSLSLICGVAAALTAAVLHGWLRLPSESEAVVLAATSLAVTAAVMVVVFVRTAAEYSALLLVGAALFAALSLWRRSAVWLPASGALYFASAVAWIDDTEDGLRIALGVVTLALSLALLAAPRSRLPRSWLRGAWELVVLAGGLFACMASMFAGGGWPAAGFIWALSLAAGGFAWERAGPFAVGVLSFYLAGMVFVADRYETSAAVGTGLLLGGLTLAAAALLWRRRFGGGDRSEHDEQGVFHVKHLC